MFSSPHGGGVFFNNGNIKVMKELEVIKIKGKDSFLIRKNSYLSQKILINGVDFCSNIRNRNFTFYKDDKIEFLPSHSNISHYENEQGVALSIDEYNNIKVSFDEESDTPSEIAKILKNRKIKATFSEVRSPIVPIPLQLKIVGVLEDTGSKFIECSINNKFSNSPIIYTVNGQIITIDEYEKLSTKHAKHAKFDKVDTNRNYLRFMQINRKYVFPDSKPFREHGYRETFSTLDQAKECEESYRDAVRNIVNKAVNPESVITSYKASQLLSRLELLHESSNKDELLKVLLDDLKEYERIRK